MANPGSYHLIAFAFDFRELAITAQEQAEAGAKRGELALADWALILKEGDRETRIETRRSTDHAGTRHGLVGGTAGLILAVASGPIGVGAVIGGAALGAATAALRDSGFSEQDLEAISNLMDAERSLLLLAVPGDATEAAEAFVAATRVLSQAADRHDTDITPGHTLADAVAELRLTEEA